MATVRIGVITDIHLAPPGHPADAFHNPFAFADAAERFQRALQRCVHDGADLIAILGDVSQPGDDATLDEGVACAAAAGLPVCLVPGNHDVTFSDDALSRAVARGNAANLCMAPLQGLVIAEGLRLAGVPLVDGASAPGARADGLDGVEWGSDAVILLSHFPIVSLRAEAHDAGLKYAGDLDDLARTAAPLLGRTAPTIVVHGHLHLGHAVSHGALLQVSCAALIEPPFVMTLLQIKQEVGQLVVRRAETSVAPVPEVPLPRLSPPDQAWRFVDEVWKSDGA